MKKGKIVGLTISLFQLATIVFAIALAVFWGLDNLPKVYIINISVDVFAMTMGFVLFVCCMIDVQKNGSRFYYFYMIVNTLFIALFSDMIAWFVDGVPSLRWVNILDNTVYYLTGSFAAFFFFKYMINILRADSRLPRLADKIMKAGLILAVILRIANIWGGFYFTVDQNGIYQRSTVYPISMTYMLFSIMIAFVIIIRYGRRLKRYQRIALYLYVLTPLITNILTAAFYGLSLISAINMLVLLLMYCVLNINQGMEKAVADRDLTMATTIQKSMLPRIFPPYPDRNEFSLYAYMKPAKEVGGDFYDFYMIDDDHLALTIADVSGKGVPAALFMMVSKVLVQSRLQSGDSPGEALKNINEQILSGGEGLRMFVTIWLCVIEISTGRGVVVNAGHEHPVIRKAGKEYEYVKYRHSPAVATVEGVEFKEHEFTMEPGDTLFVYTDGVLEATNSSVEQYGPDRLLSVLNAQSDNEVEQIVMNVARSVEEFTGDADQFDDLTVMAFRYEGPTVS